MRLASMSRLRREGVGIAVGLVLLGALAFGCGGGTLTSPYDGGPSRSDAFSIDVPIGADAPDAGPPVIVDGGLSASTDGPVLVLGPGAESLVTSPTCDVWSRSAPDAGAPIGSGAAGWAKHFADGLSISSSVDGQGRIALLSAHNHAVDFGSGPVTAPAGQLCSFLSSFTADGAHRWSRGLASGDYGHVSSWPDGGIAVLFPSAVARFTSDGAVFWARRFDDEMVSIVAQNDGSLFLVTRWTQVVPQEAARQTVTKLSVMGDVLSQFTFDDGDRASFVSISASGDIFIVHNFVFGETASSFSLSKLDAVGHLLWSRNFTSTGYTECTAVAPAAQGGVVATGWSAGDADFGGGPVMPGATGVSFAATFDSQGRHVASRAFASNGPYIAHAVTRPVGGVLFGASFSGRRTIGDATIHTGSDGDDDLMIVELDPAMQVYRHLHFGNGGGDQLLVDLALAPDGATLIAGTFQGKLDLGWGVMRTTGPVDAYLARLTENSPAPAAATPSDSEPSLPADLAGPAPPDVSCDPAATGTICDLPVSACPVSASPDAGTFIGSPTWIAYYENPRCVAGRCVWDQRYFECQGDWVCISGTCSSRTLAR
jgi:hypothetical protein